MAVRHAASIGCLCLAACGARTDLASGDPGRGAGTEEVPCVPGTFALEPAIPAVMLIIDASRSMGFDLGESQTARWTVLRDVLAQTLPPVDATMQLGALLFPSETGGELNCSVSSPALPPAKGNVGPLLELMTSRTPDGATPTADAIDAAAQALREVRAASTARSLVLATDGGPNCNGDLHPDTCTCVLDDACYGTSLLCLDGARTVDTIAGKAALGMPTYVIGIAATGSAEFAQVLDAMAVAGGRPRPADGPRYYAADSPTDLAEALAVIRDQVGACSFLTASVPDVDGTITVSIDGAPVPYDPANTSGWSWGDRANGEVLFYGGACDTVARGGHVLEATVTCDTAGASAPGDG